MRRRGLPHWHPHGKKCGLAQGPRSSWALRPAYRACCTVCCTVCCAVCCIVCCSACCAVCCTVCYACTVCCAVCCILWCTVCCILWCTVCCILWCSVCRILWCTVCCTLWCTVCCILWCTVCRALCWQCMCTVVVCCALHIVLLVHPGAVHYPLFPVPLHPALPDLPALSALRGGGGGFGTAMGGGGLPAPLCQQGSRNAAENILQPQSGRPLWGRGGGGHLSLPGAAGSLCAHVGTRAPRRGRVRALARPAAAVPAFGRAVRASLAPAALRTPVWPVENT